MTDGPPPNPPKPPGGGSLQARAIRGTLMSLASVGGGMAIRLGANVIMTRLLEPRVYGMMALMVTLEVGFKMLSDVGTRISIVSHPRGEERRFLDTAWTIEILRGLVMWVGMLLLTWPWAKFYDQPELLTLLPVFSIGLLIHSFSSTKLFVAQRRMQLGQLMVIDIGEQLLTSIVAISWALFVDRSIWALVAGPLIAGTIRLLVTHFALPGPLNRLCWDREAVKAITSFGSWIFISTTLTFFSQRLDILMMPRLLTIDQVGVYNIASQLATIPMFVGGRVVTAVLLPALSEARRLGHDKLQLAYKKAMNAVLMAGGVACLGIALGAPAFFYLLYKPEYQGAQWIAQMLVIVAWFNFCQEAATRSLQSVGVSRPLAIANAVKLVMAGAACWIGYHLGDLPGFILGAAVGALSGHVVLVLALRMHQVPAGPRDLAYTGLWLALGLIGGVAPRWLGPSFDIEPALLSIAATVVVGLPALAWVARSMMRQIRGAPQR